MGWGWMPENIRILPGRGRKISLDISFHRAISRVTTAIMITTSNSLL